jgi:hypothetical protein
MLGAILYTVCAFGAHLEVMTGASQGNTICWFIDIYGSDLLLHQKFLSVKERWSYLDFRFSIIIFLFQGVQISLHMRFLRCSLRRS